MLPKLVDLTIVEAARQNLSVIGDDKSRRDEFIAANDQGLAPIRHAMWALSGCYLNGAGTAKDCVEGVKWLRKAAGQGNAVAMASLTPATL